MELFKENIDVQQAERRKLLEEWKSKKPTKTPVVHSTAQRVPVAHSERKLLASGASRVATVSRTNHALDSPAMRVKIEDAHVKEATPLLGRPKFVSKTEAKPEKKYNVAFAEVQRSIPEKKILHFDEETKPVLEKKPAVPVNPRQIVAAAPAPPVLQRSDSVSMRLTSALAAAFRATASNPTFARRIYVGILNDTERFQNVETSSQFWISYALFEEHCGNYKDALQLYERGLELVPTEQATDLKTNMYVFMLRMDERIASATSNDEDNAADISALQSFAMYVRSSQPALLEEMRQKEEQKKKEQQEAEQQLRPTLAILMQQVAVADAEKVREADKQSTVMEATTPRRSQRLAEKERQNYALALPWWLQGESDWWSK